MKRLTLRLPVEMDEALERRRAALTLSKSDIARDSLRRYLRVAEFRELRSSTVPHAQSHGFHTDDDAFAGLEE